MDECTRDLISSLCRKAGTMMENLSLLAVTMTAQDQERASQSLYRLLSDVSRIDALLTAAAKLVDLER